MRVLFVTDFVPWPLDSGGRIRSFHILRQAAARHRVTVATHGDSGEARVLAQMTGAAVSVVPHRKEGYTRRLFGALTSIAKDQPYVVVGNHYDRKLLARVQELIADGEFNLVHFDHLDAALYVSAAKALPTLLDEHNVETRLLRRAAQRARNPLMKRYLSSQAKHLAKFEAAACSHASVVTAVSEEDARHLTSLAPSGRLCVVPNGVDIDTFRLSEHKPEPKSLIFVGSMDWFPNVDGILWFVEEVLPLLPEARLTIVGRNPWQEVVRMSKTNRQLTLSGSVPDVRPFVARSQVFIVPLRIGGGTRLKILEAFSMGVPVVSTPIGAEGLGVHDDAELLLAPDAGTFAKQVRLLFEDSELRARLVKRALAAAERLSWNKIGESLEQAYSLARISDTVESKLSI